MVANVTLANKLFDSSPIVTSSSKNYYTGTAEDLTKEDFFQDLVANGTKTADTLDDYKKLRQEKSDVTGLNEQDYEDEFQDYIKYRGCKNSEELRELDSSKKAYYATKNDLINFVKGSISSLNEDLKDCNCPTLNSNKDLDAILQNSDTADMVTLAENFQDKGEDKASFGQKVSGLVTFLSKSLNNKNLDIEIKKYLMSYLKKINSKMQDITNYSVYLTKKEKEAAKLAKENLMTKDVTKNIAFTPSKTLQNESLAGNDNDILSKTKKLENIEKYKETLISQYQN